MNETDQIELSIVMPCLNEAKTLSQCIRKAKSFLIDYNVEGEIIIADNGSTDGSQEIAMSHDAHIIHVNEKGYGNALIGGLSKANGEYIIMGDADDSYDFSALEPFLNKLRDGYDLVMGNRFKKGGIKPGAMPFLHRYFGNPMISALGKFFFKSPCGDFYCGLRGFRRDALIKWELQSTGMEFAIEMVVKSSLLSLNVAEIPTTLSPDGRDRPPHLRTWRDGWRTLRFLLIYSPRWLFFYPGLALITIGLLGMALLLPGQLNIGAVAFDIHTLLLSGIAIVLGVQTLSFAIIVNQFAINNKLLLHDSRFLSLIEKLPLERILITAVLMVLSGIFGIGYGVFFWGTVDFGSLISSHMMRILIPSVTLVVVGFQIIFASFFREILSLKMR